MKKNKKSKINGFYDLDVWKKANKLCIDVYKLTSDFPDKELFGITSQIRRAAMSVGANIAEGFGRFPYKDKINFYYNARGSSCEVQNFLFLSQELGYLEKQIARKVFIEYESLNKQINSFIKSVNNKSSDLVANDC